jgi:hypothetical protein
MKKLTKKSLDELAKTMNVIPEDERDNYWGMYENDCFWRCVAWLETGDSSEAAAASYALAYWADMMGGNTVNAHSILSTGGAGMRLSDAADYAKKNSLGSNQIICVDPDNISYYQNNNLESISGANHAIVITGEINDSNGQLTGYNVYDPQSNVNFTISAFEASNNNSSYFVHYKSN